MVLDLLTEDEKRAMTLSGELANLLHKIINAPVHALPRVLADDDVKVALEEQMRGNARNDWSEAAVKIHEIQHMIMAQAAARAYPTQYRLMGSVVLDGA